MLFYTIEPKRTDTEANNSWAKLDAKVSTLLISYVFVLFCLTSICPFGFLPPEGEVLVRGVGLCCNFLGMIQKTSTYIDILYTKMTL